MDDIVLMLNGLQQASSDIIQSVFFIEESAALGVNGTLNPYTVKLALNVLYLSMVGLLALKLCWHGYKVYVLGRDGEAEVSPTTLLTSSLYAVGVALAFPVLYKIGVEIAIGISSAATKVFPNSLMWTETIIMSDMPDLIMDLFSNFSQNIVFHVLLLVYCIIYVILFFKMLGRGVQLLLYRMGVPLAVAGLINSDGGIWKSYVQIYFQQLVIAMIQNFCIRMSMALISSASGSFLSIGVMIFGIVFLVTAFSTPKIFNSILQQTNGGSGRGTQIMYTVMMAARSFGGGA